MPGFEADCLTIFEIRVGTVRCSIGFSRTFFFALPISVLLCPTYRFSSALIGQRLSIVPL